MILRVKSHISLSLIYLNKTFLIYNLSFLNWNWKRLRWEKETVYSVLRSMKISVGSIQSTWLWERGGGGGVRTISMRRLHWKRKETFLNIFANGVFRCHLDSGVSQLLLCYQQPFLLRGGGVSAHFKSTFFLPKLRPNIFHSSVTIVINREGWDKNIPSYTGGMVDDAKFSKTCFKNQSADVKGTLWSTI